MRDTRVSHSKYTYIGVWNLEHETRAIWRPDYNRLEASTRGVFQTVPTWNDFWNAQRGSVWQLRVTRGFSKPITHEKVVRLK